MPVLVGIGGAVQGGAPLVADQPGPPSLIVRGVPATTRQTSLEAGPAGSTIAQTGNGGDNFTGAVTAAGTTFTYDNTVPASIASGAFSAKLDNPTAGALNTFRAWGSLGANDTHHLRAYVYITALPSSVFDIFQLVDTASGLIRARLRVGTTGAPTLVVTGQTLSSTTSALPLDTLVRLEASFNFAAGTASLDAYTGHSVTPFTSQSWSALTYPGPSADLVRVGGVAVPATYTAWLDDVGWSNVARLGPSNAPAVSSAGSIDLGGSASGQAVIASVGSVDLGAGSPTATGTAALSGSIELSGSATGGTGSPASGTGAVTLGGSATAAAPVSASGGSLTLGGTTVTAFSFTENFEGGTDGAAITTANTRFTSVGANQTFAASSPTPVQGSLALKVAPAASTATVSANTFTAVGALYLRFYLYLTANPVGGIFDYILGRNGATNLGHVTQNAAGTVTLKNGATSVYTSAWTIPLNAWCRVEYVMDSGASTQQLRLFTGANLHGSTADQDSGAQTYTMGPISEIRIGAANNAATTPPVISYDAYAQSSFGWVGPIAGSGAAATAAGSVTLGGSATAAVPASSAGTVSLSGTATATAPASATGSITLGSAAIASTPIAAAGTLTLGSTVTVSAPVSASGSVQLSGAGTARAPGSATGSVTLGGSTATSAPISAVGSITLGSSAAATAPVSSAGTVTLSGAATAAGTVAAAGSITLSGTTIATSQATASGSIILGGSTTPQAPGASAGSVALGGTTSAVARITATGAVTLSGTAAATAPGGASATGSITLSGTATARAATSSGGTVTLSGTSTAAAPAASSGTVTLTGTVTPAAPVSTSGSVTLSGASSAQAPLSALGNITIIGGTVTAQAPASSGGSIVLGGAVTLLIPATTAGLITLGGLANAAAAQTLRDITVTYGTGSSRSLTVVGSSRSLTAGPPVSIVVQPTAPTSRTFAAAGTSRALIVQPGS